MNIRNQYKKRAFTLIELMVTVAIVAVLVGILLPAVQQAREAARRTQCKSNLKQIGLALHNYHDSFRVFPSGWIGTEKKYPAPDGESGFAWASMILPFVDQGGLFNEIDFNKSVDHNRNRSMIATFIGLYSCPSDPKPDTFTIKDRTGTEVKMAVTNYVGVFGTTHVDTCNNMPGKKPVTPSGQCVSDGVFYHNSNTRLRDLLDGASSTLLVGERTSFVENQGNYFWGTWAGALPEISEAVSRIVGHAKHAPNQNHHPEDFGSSHVSGTHFVMADGSVRFISNSIDETVFQSLATKVGQEIVGEF